jgi:type IV secretory pathway component VirB8
MAEYKQTQMWNLDEMKHIQVSNHLYLLTIMVVSCIAVLENLSIS